MAGWFGYKGCGAGLNIYCEKSYFAFERQKGRGGRERRGLRVKVHGCSFWSAAYNGGRGGSADGRYRAQRAHWGVGGWVSGWAGKGRGGGVYYHVVLVHLTFRLKVITRVSSNTARRPRSTVRTLRCGGTGQVIPKKNK